ncbi:MAG: molecular chaperone GrpE [Halanaerobiales bacterium]|nr:molecular chaperone GrpE [Halanaerobiales bacterium]
MIIMVEEKKILKDSENEEIKEEKIEIKEEKMIEENDYNKENTEEGESKKEGEVEEGEQLEEVETEAVNSDEEETETVRSEEKIIGKETKELEKKVAELEAEKEKYYDQLLRLQADFINFRKRVSKEKERISFVAKTELIAELLPVVDNFERALSSAGADDDFKKGIDLIYRQLLKFLENQGVEVIPTVGEYFDHNLHEAMMQVEDADYESGMIIEELQKGYILDDKVIRPAMVKVAK